MIIYVGLLATFSSPAFVDALARGQSLNDQSTCDRNASASPGPGIENVESSTAGGYLWPYQVFKSSPVTPPVMEINRTEATKATVLAPGLITITITATSGGGRGDSPVTNWQGPQIFTDEGRLVWAGPNVAALNLREQKLNGEPVLTYWSGDTTEGLNVGHGYGHITFLDNTYQTKTVLCPRYTNQITAGGVPHECGADMHEAQMTERGTMLVSAYNATSTDLTSLGGPADGWVWDSQIYELDPLTGEELFRWSSVEHVPANRSRYPLETNGNSTAPFDYFHINSVVDVGDFYLVNSRHCWSVYLIDKQGTIVWHLDGADGGDFGPLPDGIGFRWQHYARLHSIADGTGMLSIYNNNNYDSKQTEPLPTELLMYELPMAPEAGSNSSRASVRSIIQTVEPLFSSSQGSYIPALSNDNKLATYGPLPMVKEFDSLGREIWSGRVGVDNLAQVYRGYKSEWHATPYTKPDLVTEDGKGYVSWNGATDVTAWNVYVGTSSDKLDFAGQTGFRGFETQFNMPCWATHVQIGAVEGDREVRRSEVVRIQ